MSRVAPRLALFGSVFMLVAACSTAGPPSSSPVSSADPTADMPMSSDDQSAGFAWGEPAEPANADRVVEIRMTDELRFEPAEVTVLVGEVVTFKVINAGQIPHDFTLGDEETQADHEAEMAAGGMPGMGHDEPNVLTLDPGQAGDLTWRFTAPASILYGCHLPGHYAAGMVGTLSISGS